MSNWILNITKDGGSTTTLGSLLQCLNTTKVVIVYFMFKWTLLFPFLREGELLTLLHCSSVRSLLCGATLQEQAAPVLVPHGITCFANKPGSAKTSHWVTASFGNSPAGVRGYPWAMREIHFLNQLNLLRKL